MATRQWIGLILGPLTLLLTLLLPAPDGLSEAGWRTAGAASWMAIWWLTEAVPIPITALIPMAVFPLLGLGPIKEVTAPYANPLVFLFLGGFVVALAMQRWNLHKRVAINLLGWFGTRPDRIIAGFLVCGALLSMWVSNTATSLMMLPIALSVVALLPNDADADSDGGHFATALLLAVAYGATSGGMATLIGTPPNALLAAYLNRVYHFHVGFAQWMAIGIPVSLVALTAVYFVLTRVAFRFKAEPLKGMQELLETERTKLGPFSRGETIVAITFSITALAWVFRPFLANFVPAINDTSIAITAAIALYVIPVDWKKGIFAMDWETAKKLPWDILLLFGGGLSLASAIQDSGLAEYLGGLTAALDALPVLLIACILAFGILMLTELTSNTATAATFLPIVGAIAVSMGENPLLFLAPAALAANCSYMMPVGTPPNAIVFGSGRIRLGQMARAGILLNVLLVPIIVGLFWFLGPIIFGVETGVVPDWAK